MSHRPTCNYCGPGGPCGEGARPRRGGGAGETWAAGRGGAGPRSGTRKRAGRYAEVLLGLPGSQPGAGRHQVSLCEATVCPRAETATVNPLRNTFKKWSPPWRGQSATDRARREGRGQDARPRGPGSADTSGGASQGTESKEEGLEQQGRPHR